MNLKMNLKVTDDGRGQLEHLHCELVPELACFPVLTVNLSILNHLRWRDPVFLQVHFPSLNILDLNKFIFIAKPFYHSITHKLNFLMILCFGRSE